MLQIRNTPLRYLRLHFVLPKVTYPRRFAEGYPKFPPLPFPRVSLGIDPSLEVVGGVGDHQITNPAIFLPIDSARLRIRHRQSTGYRDAHEIDHTANGQRPRGISQPGDDQPAAERPAGGAKI